MTGEPILGLRVRLRPCPACGLIIATVVNGNAMTCDSCGRKRGRLDSETQRCPRSHPALVRTTLSTRRRKRSESEYLTNRT